MTAAGAAGGRLYAGYVLLVLFAANVLNLLDRSILGIVTEPVRRELALSDTQMSLASGFAFVLFHLVAGVFIARLADRGDRRLILAAGVACWSLATGLTGYVTGFGTLLLTRVFVGIGEATVFPVAISLIGDYFAREARPRSVAVFQLSNFVGVVAGSILAGVLAQAHGWRFAFVACGFAGLAVALVVVATLRNPPRGGQDPDAARRLEGVDLRAALCALSRVPGFVLLAIGYGVSGMSVAILPTWAPAFLQRSHGVDLAEIGRVIGPAVGGGGAAGVLLSGFLASWLVKRTGRDTAGLLVPLFALPLAVPCFAGFLFASSLGATMACVGFGNFFLASSLGPCVALGIAVAPLAHRGLGSMMLLFAQALIGGAAGPVLVGAASDWLRASMGDESLRYAMSFIVVAPGIASVLLWAAYVRMRGATVHPDAIRYLSSAEGEAE